MNREYPLTLILGGARSGKSRYAQTLAEAACSRLTYIATAEALDDEMAARIAQHIEDRGPSWERVEAPLRLGAAIDTACVPGRAVLVDCLTLWLSNMMHAEQDLERETDGLIETLGVVTSPLILVSNEVGMGIVPDNALSRAFRDAQGRTNAAVAATCDRVEFVAAGLPLRLKG